MKAKYPVIQENYKEDNGYVNAYLFIDKLCGMLNNYDIIVPESSGSAGEITYQAFKVKMGQKIKNAAGLGSMGFGLPYAIGSCLANGRKRTILINGDGAFQLNIQELQTVVRLNLPIKIFIWNNSGYASIMATQRNLFDGRYVASEESSGLVLPDISKIAKAYGMKTFKVKKNDELSSCIEDVLNASGPVLCEVMTSPYETVAPKVQSQKTPEGSMISKPLEDMWPFLDEDELRENMIGDNLC
jgi:acetolactate synthase-1/2/3 large subunit